MGCKDDLDAADAVSLGQMKAPTRIEHDGDGLASAGPIGSEQCDQFFFVVGILQRKCRYLADEVVSVNQDGHEYSPFEC